MKKISIQDAMAKLDPNKKRHWDDDGFPSIGFLSKQTGMQVDRAYLQSAFPEFFKIKEQLVPAPVIPDKSTHKLSKLDLALMSRKRSYSWVV